MGSDTIPNQSNYIDAQSYDIDIDKIYNDFISAIDAVRSYNNSSDITDASVAIVLRNASTIKDARSNLFKLCHLDKINVQESRCHAFYRIIGFPVCSNDNIIYNPGHDIIFSSERKVNDAFKLGIIKKPIEGFRALSRVRENYTISNNKIFALPTTIDAGTLALSSGVKVRQFSSSLLNIEPFDVKLQNQQYKVNFSSLVGDSPKQLNEYVDVMGETPKQLSKFTQRTHILKPFLVDPIIDLTVNDSTKLIAVPFVNNKQNLKVKDGVNGYVNRPIIEKVIRDRFSVTNQEVTTGTADQSILDYIKNVPAIQDEDIIKQVTDVYKLSDQTQFLKYFNIMRTMIKQLVKAQVNIQTIQSKYYWVPVPSSIGPEGGCTVQGVFLSDKVPSDFITNSDQSIIDAQIKSTLNEINSDTSEINGIPDVGGFAIPADSFVQLGTSPGLGDNSAQNLASLVAKRTADLNQAGKSLRTIEIIMGEFSGLGLCDIIAILAALYLMPKDSLLGFLDDDAFERLRTSPDALVEDIGTNPSDIENASNDFIGVLKDMYSLMDQVFLDESQNNGLA